MKTIFNAIKVNTFNWYLACDFKLQNIVLGLGSHTSNHPCGYCNKHKDCFGCKGCPTCANWIMRTLGTIREQCRLFRALKSNKAADFDNCINDPLFPGPDSTTIFEICPPDELHLMLGIVKKIVDELNERWGNDDLFEWLVVITSKLATIISSE